MMFSLLVVFYSVNNMGLVLLKVGNDEMMTGLITQEFEFIYSKPRVLFREDSLDHVV